MFTRPTVFIIGAGASVPFNFPSGGTLLQLITCAISLRHTDQNSEIINVHRRLLEVLGIQNDQVLVKAFVQKLRDSLTPSIDTWLTQNKDFMAIGKAAISTLICHFESGVRMHPSEPDDWYKWVFHRMLSDCKSADQFVRQPVVFITFNYDRMLEYVLGNAIENFFGNLKSEDRKKMIEAVHDKIIHVHGVLSFDDFQHLQSSFGSFNLNGMDNNIGERRVQALNAIASEIDRLAGGIRIIGENRTDSSVEARVANAIYSAHRIIFLGFGYDERNLSILRLKDRVKELHASPPPNSLQPLVLGTAVGLRTAQVDDVKSYFNDQIFLGDSRFTSVAFCDEYISKA